MDRDDYLSREVIEALLPLAKARGVLQAFPRAEAFLEACKNTNWDPKRLPKIIAVERQALIRRWSKVNTDWWCDAADGGAYPDGESPSNRHLFLILWGWSPDDAELAEWVDAWQKQKKSWSVKGLGRAPA